MARGARADRLDGPAVDGVRLLAGGDADAEVAEEPVPEPVDPAVDREGLPAPPGVLGDGGEAEVPHLLDHVRVPQADQDLIFGGNAARLLGLAGAGAPA